MVLAHCGLPQSLARETSDDGLAGGTRRLRLLRRVRGGDAARRIIQPARLAAAPEQPERLTAGRKAVRPYHAVSCINRCAAYRNGTPQCGQPLVSFRPKGLATASSGAGRGAV
ncbi:unnamed protein product [Chrysodeixis includens]|uniref:Uncharacterized protein n=1 Tax=Chrysodeixis includens TaxID=689277 RepID=A0A9N8KYM5_CHRIL|nr:unnamed protein product [Chrysodeixis includens]